MLIQTEPSVHNVISSASRLLRETRSSSSFNRLKDSLPKIPLRFVLQDGEQEFIRLVLEGGLLPPNQQKGSLQSSDRHQ